MRLPAGPTETLESPPQGRIDELHKPVEIALAANVQEILALPRREVIRPQPHQLAHPHPGIAEHPDDQLVAFGAGCVLKALYLLAAEDVLDRPAELRQPDLAVWHIVLDARFWISRPNEHLVHHPYVGMHRRGRERAAGATIRQQLALLTLRRPPGQLRGLLKSPRGR